MNRIITLVAALMFFFTGATQNFSLQQAIDTAVTNNLQVRQNRLLVDVAEVNWKQAKANLLPDLNASLNHGINQGRSIDPFTNTYINQKISYAGYSANSGVLLFNGRSLQNNIHQNAYAYDASKMEWQQLKDNLVLNVIVAYLDVLSTEDQLRSATSQAEVSKKQLERLEILDSQGAIIPSQVSDVKGQLMNDQITISNLKNQLEVAKLSLAQLMYIPYSPGLSVERIDVEELLTSYSRTSSEVFQNALQRFAQVKAVELRTKSAQYGLKAAKGQRYPSLVLGGSLNTNYSSAAQTAAGKIPYNEQINNNLFSQVNLGIRIPIFNGNQARNRIRLAEIEVKSNELAEENTKVQLRQQVEQAHLNMTNAFERYKLLREQVKAYEQSFQAAEARLNAGVGTTVDFLIAKNNLDRATINLITSKYEFVFRKKILDYYNGEK